MVSKENAETLATATTLITVVSQLASKLQNPNCHGRSAAMDHKVASVLMKRLNKYLVNKDA